jgi:hypothetical protein
MSCEITDGAELGFFVRHEKRVDGIIALLPCEIREGNQSKNFERNRTRKTSPIYAKDSCPRS